MSKTTSIIIAVIILGGAFYFTSNGSSKTSSITSSTQKKVSSIPVENSVIKDGVQYITITAQAGYSSKDVYC